MLNTTYQLQHLTLMAAEEIQMRRFYRDILGLVETSTGEKIYHYAFIQNGDPFLTLNFNGLKPTTPRQGLYHFALLLPDTASLASLIEKILFIQYPLGAGDHDVSEAFYLNDPDGNGIELYHDRPQSQWVWDRHFVRMGTKDVDVKVLLATQQRRWSGFPSETTIGHLHFVGDHLSTGDHFFVRTLQMDMTATMAQSAHFYSHNHYHHHHAYNTWFGEQIKPRALAETGLVSWRVLVDPPYFEHLQMQFSGHVHWVAADTFTVTDPFKSTLIIKKS